MRVEDDGIGLPEGFDPRRSTGLGMRIVMTLARRLRAEVAVGRGAGGELRARLAGGRGGGGVTAGAAPGRPVRVLVVEDDGLVALEIEAYLTGAGHEVVGVAAGAAEALALGRRLDPDPAPVDVRLRGAEDGPRAAAGLREAGVPCLFVAAACPAERGLGLGCLPKPFTEGDLLAAVAAAGAVLRGHSPRHVPPVLEPYAG